MNPFEQLKERLEANSDYLSESDLSQLNSILDKASEQAKKKAEKMIENLSDEKKEKLSEKGKKIEKEN